MAIYVGPESILACTVGQLEHNYDVRGVDHSDLEQFCLILKQEIGSANEDYKSKYIYFEWPTGDVKYMNDHWRNHFQYFDEKYKLTFDEIFNKTSQITVKMAIELLKNAFRVEGIEKKECDEILNKSIDRFLQYYADKLDKKNACIESKDPRKKLTSSKTHNTKKLNQK